jgi:hypothetical protein
VTEITDCFPLVKLDPVIAEAQESLPDDTIFPREIGGDEVKLLIGIQQTELAPRLLLTLPSGICVFESKFTDIFGSNVCFGGPHAIFTEACRTFSSGTRFSAIRLLQSLFMEVATAYTKSPWAFVREEKRSQSTYCLPQSDSSDPPEPTLEVQELKSGEEPRLLPLEQDEGKRNLQPQPNSENSENCGLKPETPDSAASVDFRQALKARDLSDCYPKHPVPRDAKTRKSTPVRPVPQKKLEQHRARFKPYTDARAQPRRPPDQEDSISSWFGWPGHHSHHDGDPVLPLLVATQLYQKAVPPVPPRQFPSGSSPSLVPPDKGTTQ